MTKSSCEDANLVDTSKNQARQVRQARPAARQIPTGTESVLHPTLRTNCQRRAIERGSGEADAEAGTECRASGTKTWPTHVSWCVWCEGCGRAGRQNETRSRCCGRSSARLAELSARDSDASGVGLSDCVGIDFLEVCGWHARVFASAATVAEGVLQNRDAVTMVGFERWIPRRSRWGTGEGVWCREKIVRVLLALVGPPMGACAEHTRMFMVKR